MSRLHAQWEQGVGRAYDGKSWRGTSGCTAAVNPILLLAGCCCGAVMKRMKQSLHLSLCDLVGQQQKKQVATRSGKHGNPAERGLSWGCCPAQWCMVCTALPLLLKTFDTSARNCARLRDIDWLVQNLPVLWAALHKGQSAVQTANDDARCVGEAKLDTSES